MMIVQITLPHVTLDDLLQTNTLRPPHCHRQYVRPHRHHVYGLAVAVCEAHMRRPVVQLKDLVISPIYSPKLTLPARQGRRVVL